jgi:hypothetical protein
VSSIERIEAGAEAAGREAGSSREWVLEAVREGYLMHYAEPRALADADPDLRLLGGDAMYALGLARLADAGDIDAVAVLADLISACAQAESEGRDTAPWWDRAGGALAHENRVE